MKPHSQLPSNMRLLLQRKLRRIFFNTSKVTPASAPSRLPRE